MLTKTIGDVIIEKAKEGKPLGTYEGMMFLELEDKPENYFAGNMMASAISIIKKLLDKKENRS